MDGLSRKMFESRVSGRVGFGIFFSGQLSQISSQNSSQKTISRQHLNYLSHVRWCSRRKSAKFYNYGNTI